MDSPSGPDILARRAGQAAGETIATVGAFLVKAPLRVPLVFGSWRIKSREYCVVGVRSTSGETGFAYGLTRDGPVAEVVRGVIAAHYVGRSVEDPAGLFANALAANRPVLSAGIGLRALSLVDIAAWDLSLRARGATLIEDLGGRPCTLPGIAIVGYPPALDGEAIGEQVKALVDEGWRRFKLPVGDGVDRTIRRVRAAVDVAGEGRVILDGAWSFPDAASVARVLDRVGAELLWVEDAVPPGQTASLRELRGLTTTPVAMGDEQGGPDFPSALLDADAVDIVRIDATCAGGITSFGPIVRLATGTGTKVSTHIFGPIHAQLVAGLGLTDSPIEWPLAGIGVDPFSESLWMPTPIDGGIEVQPRGSGLGQLTNADWIGDQVVIDPEGVLTW